MKPQIGNKYVYSNSIMTLVEIVYIRKDGKTEPDIYKLAYEHGDTLNMTRPNFERQCYPIVTQPANNLFKNTPLCSWEGILSELRILKDVIAPLSNEAINEKLEDIANSIDWDALNKEIWFTVNWIAKNNNGHIYLYEDMPSRVNTGRSVRLTSNLARIENPLMGNLFKDIPWEMSLIKRPSNKRILKYTIVDVDEEGIHVQIIEQSHIRKDFTPNGDTFTHNGFKLSSHDSPTLCSFGNDWIWVRGRKKDKDNDIIIMKKKMFLKFKAAVNAYNQKFN